jgi:hypothetical protein
MADEVTSTSGGVNLIVAAVAAADRVAAAVSADLACASPASS